MTGVSGGERIARWIVAALLVGVFPLVAWSGGCSSKKASPDGSPAGIGGAADGGTAGKGGNGGKGGTSGSAGSGGTAGDTGGTGGGQTGRGGQSGTGTGAVPPSYSRW